MLHVGLTGNIASGKSHASSVFAEFGAHVIDADVIAHELLDPGTPTYREVVEAFGEGIVRNDGSIDRKALGAVVFSDGEKRLLLNRLVHPNVRAELLKRVFELESTGVPGIVIIDAALIVESGFYRLQDCLVVVVCHPRLQAARIMERDGLTFEQAKQRMDVQMPAEEKLKLADFTIDTSGTFRETREQIRKVYAELVLLERKKAGRP